MPNQKPRHGWIYKVNPTQTYVRCSKGHSHQYDHTIDRQTCLSAGCDCLINPSRAFRGFHPVVIWNDDALFDQAKSIGVFIVLPVTSKETFAGLPTSYPIKANTRNGLDVDSYVLAHNPITVDCNAFKNSGDRWLERIGVLNTDERTAVNERLAMCLNLNGDSILNANYHGVMNSDDFLKHFKMFPADEQMGLVEMLINAL